MSRYARDMSSNAGRTTQFIGSKQSWEDAKTSHPVKISASLVKLHGVKKDLKFDFGLI